MKTLSLALCLVGLFLAAEALPQLNKGSGGPVKGGGGSSNGGGPVKSGGGTSGGGAGPVTGGGSNSGGGLGKGNSGRSGVQSGGGSSSGGNSGGLGKSSGGFGSSSSGGNRQSGQSSQVGLGRVDLPPNRGGRSIETGQVLGRGGSAGRTGAPNYGSNNNFAGNRNQNRLGAVDVPSRLPTLEKGSINSQALRLNEARPRYDRGEHYSGGYRIGYHQYHNSWRDDYFWYSHYRFDPYRDRCTISPWYSYGHLPGYIVVTRIIFIDSWRGPRWDDGHVIRVGSGFNGGWDRWDNDDRWDDRGDRELYRSLEDLQRAFERRDRRALGNLIGRDRVNIYHDGRYSYSLSGDDFYDLMLDAIYATDTRRYEIRSVRATRGGLTVNARHTYRSAWGLSESVTHTYRFEEDRYGYSITDFSVGRRDLF